MIYADTSFLVALAVVADHHRSDAWNWWRSEGTPVFCASRLTLFEAENTIRGKSVAGSIRLSEVTRAMDFIYRLRLEGLLVRRRVDDHRLFPHATRLSQFHTTSSAFGALDILHVATALELRATTFLSFDNRQLGLAEAEGLNVAPN